MRLLALIVAIPLCAQEPVASHNPDSARLVSTDIARFWRVFDTTPRDSASFQRSYLDSGTVGLNDFVPHRIESSGELAAVIAAHARYYAAIRANTLAIDTAAHVKDAIRASFRRLANLCPEALFPDVYFVIGAMSSGGTSSSHGMIIGVEMFSRDDSTPMDELDAWHRAVIGRIVDLPTVVAHELIHVQQAPLDTPITVLDQSMREGGADFIGELISGGRLNRVQHVYGDAHEQELRTAFAQAMDGRRLSDWFYQGDKSGDHPPDLGYYEGYKIAEAYYRRAKDKRAAACTIMHAANPSDLRRRSGYFEGE
ncbi:MAG TPA: DUF2268 domain-containing putative Zn-dependent protease [Gemmatimonadaceae bacterium]|nr:DUF2268 domain-containing putative Zn-dependent protease [Gemmatimonadaceae bacterium]